MAEYFTKDGDGYKKVDENLLTQADVDGVVEKRLERERGKYADYDTLKEKAGKVDTITKDFEGKLKEKDTKIGELEGSVKSAKLETDKVKLINEFGLSEEDHGEFITGETAEEMRQKAEKLHKSIGGKGVTITKKPKPGEGKSSDSKDLARKLFKRDQSD